MSSKISYSDKKWIESEYPKFYDKILRKSMSLAAGDYFGIYCHNMSGKIGFTEHFTTKNRTGTRLKNELNKKMEEFIEQLESKDHAIFYIMKTPSTDVFAINSIQQTFEKKVQQAFCNYMDIKDQKYSEMDSRNEFF